MPFSTAERSQLLQVKGVGAKVIERLEQLGIDSFPKLAQQDAVAVCSTLAEMMDSTCWKNSPQARNAIQSAIALAECALSHSAETCPDPSSTRCVPRASAQGDENQATT